MKKILVIAILLLSAGVVSCGSSSVTSTYTVSVALTGLATSKTVVFQNNSGDNLTMTSNTTTAFTTALADGSTYSVAVSSQPSNETCTVTSGSGTISGANVTVNASCVFDVKVIFITAATTTGNIGSIAAADALCAADANKPDAGTYKAMIVDGPNRQACTSAGCTVGGASEHTDWVLSASTAYYRPDGTTAIATTTSNGVFNLVTELTNSFSATSYGVWSGMLGDWTTSPGGSCTNWSSSAGGESANYGDTSKKDTNAISTAVQACSTSSYLACVEQ